MTPKVQAQSARKLVDTVRPADVVVIGSGVAGLSAALALAPRSVTLLTKTELARGSASEWAQGGVAAAVGRGDTPELHTLDTLAAGAGFCDRIAVDVLTAEGPERIRELIDLGACFDRDARGELCLGREGAHRRRRVLHAGGDATGAEMVRALAAAVRRAEHVDVREGAFATDLVVDAHGRVVGVLAGGVFYRSAAVVLATGGLGQLYEHTTNPVAATGDGLALAARAGARLADLEMIQFHPTAMDVTADPCPLVTEALRGEGALLVDDRGERFMVDVHPLAELAPRDIVARAIWRRQQDGRRVFLDATGAVGDAFPERFPTVFASCREHGIDPRREPIPVTPAAHYAMAGVVTDTAGRTSLDGLWACGEVAATGVHGANRLASNSLLEGLVFGRRVAASVRDGRAAHGLGVAGVVYRETPGEDADVRGRIRRLMWNGASVVRCAKSLGAVLDGLATLSAGGASETANLLLLGRLVTTAALAREESRGAHFRSDFPDVDASARRHEWTLGEDGNLAAVASEGAEREIA